MSEEPKYTLIERNGGGYAVNTITGLDKLLAETTADILRSGDAYNREPGLASYTCDVVREPTTAEVLAHAVEDWIAGVDTIGRADALAACLRHAASRLDVLRDAVIPATVLKVELHVIGDHTPTGAAARMERVDGFAELFGLDRINRNGIYTTDSGNDRFSSGVTAYTVAGVAA